jgi:carbamoyl-phosphate synthase large subunit
LSNAKNLSILITSAGGLTGLYLLRHLRQHSLSGYTYRLVAIDSNPLVACAKWCDSFYTVPPVSSLSFEGSLLSILEREHVDIIIPVTSYDIDFFSAWNVPEWSGKYLCISNEALVRLNNKRSLYAWSKKNGILTPKVYNFSDNPVFPLIIKPEKGSGSKDVMRVNSEKEFDLFFTKHNHDDFVITQFLHGKEYTIDCLFNCEGRLLGYHARERLKITSGAATTSKSAFTLDLHAFFDVFDQERMLRGAANFQVIESEQGELYLTDLNPRFASGGLALTVACGFDIPNKLIELLLTGKTEAVSPSSLSEKTMVRYYEEYFI